MSVATVVSVVPFDIEERYTGMRPNVFRIPAAKPNEIEILVIPDGFNLKYIDADRGTIEIPKDGMEIARSLIHDYTLSHVLATDKMCPGMFVIAGEYTKKVIEDKFATQIKAARERQEAWFKLLVKEADDTWRKFGQHKMITDTARKAATLLNLRRDWVDPTSMHLCPVCQEQVSSLAIVCKTCNAVLKPEEYSKIQFANKEKK